MHLPWEVYLRLLFNLRPRFNLLPLSYVQVVPLDKASAAAVIEGFSKQALRTLSVAYRELKPSELPKPDGNRPWPEDVPVPDTGLILQAIVGIKDPLRKEVKKSINVCKEAGINVSGTLQCYSTVIYVLQ